MSKKENPETRKNKIKENLPLFWNAYQHMYDARGRNIQESINFLLIITTFLPLLCITLYTTSLFNNPLILIPVIFQIIALLILLKSFFINDQKIPWFELDLTLDTFNEDNFESSALASLKAAEQDTYTGLVKKNKIVKCALWFLILSFYLMFVTLAFILIKEKIILYLIIIAITIIFAIFVIKNYSEIRSSAFDKTYLDAKKQIAEWVIDGKHK